MNALQRKATEPGSQSKSKYIEKAGTAAVPSTTEHSSVTTTPGKMRSRTCPLQREKKEKETRSETRAPTATVPPRRTKKRKQIDWDEVIRAEAVVEAQRLELERAAASPQVDEEASGAQVAECPICLEKLDDASPALACDHRLHAVCLQELAATAWAEGAARTRARGTAVLCPCCRAQSYVK